MKVLAVENSPHLCKRILRLLADAGYTATDCVAGIGQALEQIQRDRPDAILLNLILDDGSGYNLLKALRAMGLELPVVVLSENQGDPYQILAQELGVVALLHKFTQFEEIVPTLKQIRSVQSGAVLSQQIDP